jgi:3-(3-hydroxy-phenyl)propionate hydroxylase
MTSYTYPKYPYVTPPELAVPGCVARTWPVAIVGAGLTGPTLALDLAQRGIDVLLLDEDDTVSYGSRSVCQAKRSLEVWDRLGAAEPMLAKGVTWDTGHIFLGAERVYSFNLQPERHHKLPAFINLQQYYVEQFLIERCRTEPRIDLRFASKVTAVRPANDHVALTVETPDGSYEVRAQWLVACDGVRSPVRQMLGLPFEGEVFDDQFLIADIRAQTDLPAERHFWFDPPFHPGWSVLIHRQADDIMRVDWQLGREHDPVHETRPESIDARLKALFGPQFRYELEWASMYTFTCRQLARFVHGRVIFAGDSAHVVSPFGARGGNAGVQDADNLGWKLALVLEEAASPRLLESYDAERHAAAVENSRISTRSTDFITPKFAASRLFRDGALALSAEFPFARALVNSGRLSVATTYAASPLNVSNGPDADWGRALRPGAAAPDGPVGEGGWLIDAFGRWFALLAFVERASDLATAPFAAAPGLAVGAHPLAALAVVADRDAASAGWTLLEDSAGTLAERYDAQPGTVWLVRPDRHIAGRWRSPSLAQLEAALAVFRQ